MQQNLSATHLLSLTLVVQRAEEEQVDRVGWLTTNGGKFTVKSVYQLDCQWPEESRCGWLQANLEDEASIKGEGVHLYHVTC